MLKRGFMAIVVAGMTLAGAGLAHSAETARNGALPSAMAKQLDGQSADYTMSAAAQRRHMIIRENMRQQRYGRGYRRGGPNYGYRRDFGPRRDYGYRRGYYGAPRGYGRGQGRMYNGQPVLRAN